MTENERSLKFLKQLCAGPPRTPITTLEALRKVIEPDMKRRRELAARLIFQDDRAPYTVEELMDTPWPRDRCKSD